MLKSGGKSVFAVGNVAISFPADPSQGKIDGSGHSASTNSSIDSTINIVMEPVSRKISRRRSTSSRGYTNTRRRTSIPESEKCPSTRKERKTRPISRDAPTRRASKSDHARPKARRSSTSSRRQRTISTDEAKAVDKKERAASLDLDSHSEHRMASEARRSRRPSSSRYKALNQGSAEKEVSLKTSGHRRSIPLKKASLRRKESDGSTRSRSMSQSDHGRSITRKGSSSFRQKSTALSGSNVVGVDHNQKDVSTRSRSQREQRTSVERKRSIPFHKPGYDAVSVGSTEKDVSTRSRSTSQRDPVRSLVRKASFTFRRPHTSSVYDVLTMASKEKDPPSKRAVQSEHRRSVLKRSMSWVTGNSRSLRVERRSSVALGNQKSLIRNGSGHGRGREDSRRRERRTSRRYSNMDVRNGTSESKGFNESKESADWDTRSTSPGPVRYQDLFVNEQSEEVQAKERKNIFQFDDDEMTKAWEQLSKKELLELSAALSAESIQEPFFRCPTVEDVPTTTNPYSTGTTKKVHFDDNVEEHKDLEAVTRDWYSKDYLEDVLAGEVQMASRCNTEKGNHCSWRGLEYFKTGFDRKSHVRGHVRVIMGKFIALDSKQKECMATGEEFDAVEELRKYSCTQTANDRHKALKLAQDDADFVLRMTAAEERSNQDRIEEIALEEIDGFSIETFSTEPYSTQSSLASVSTPQKVVSISRFLSGVEAVAALLSPQAQKPKDILRSTPQKKLSIVSPKKTSKLVANAEDVADLLSAQTHKPEDSLRSSPQKKVSIVSPKKTPKLVSDAEVIAALLSSETPQPEDSPTSVAAVPGTTTTKLVSDVVVGPSPTITRPSWLQGRRL